VLGKLYAALNRAIAADDLAQARALQGLSQDYVAILMDTGVIPGVKLSLRLLGCDAGPARPPMQLRDAAAQDRLRAFLESPAVRPWLP
jgi:N-acetylneuraminate lyase